MRQSVSVTGLLAAVVLSCAVGSAAAGAAVSPAGERVQVVHAGTLLAVPGEAPAGQMTIVLSGNRIAQVAEGFLEPDTVAPDAALIDLSDHFVLPGLMDMHVHLLVEIGPDARSRALRDSTSFTAMRGVGNAHRTLHAGFTTVRDLGGDPEAIYAIRDAVARGYIRGPRVFAAGSPLAATGGHGDVDGMKSELLDLWTPKTICDGAVSCRRAVRYAVKHGADWIKITATGGVLSDTGTGLGQQMTNDELGEIVATAHNLGVKVAAHAHGTQGVNAALRAGVDTIDHGSFLDRDSIRLFKQNDAHFVPTLMPGHFIPAQMVGNPFFTPDIVEKANRASLSAKKSFRMALEGGVNIAFGTDTGVTPHGDNAMEFELMVAEGMSEMAAIRSATITTAALLGIADELGSIEPGKLADLIAVSGDPLTDIRALQSVQAVIANGVLVKRL
jgi:imidazolonepropionase-like amidohydrolase